MIKLRQDDENDCVLATCAMIMDESIDSIRDKFSNSYCNRCGITDETMTMMLNEHGFGTMWKWKWYEPQKQYRNIWPPEPFAEVHLGKVRVLSNSRLSHSIVMLKDGTVWDPEQDEEKRLTDYEEVLGICGIVRNVTPL